MIPSGKKMAGGRRGDFKKHSEVRPQGGHVYNYKALQRVAGEPAVLKVVPRPGAIFFIYDCTFDVSIIFYYYGCI